MGPPVSSVIANLVMENIEIRALEIYANLPRLWKRYVNDTFLIMKKSKLFEFFTHVSTVESVIQLTMKGTQIFHHASFNHATINH